MLSKLSRLEKISSGIKLVLLFLLIFTLNKILLHKPCLNIDHKTHLDLNLIYTMFHHPLTHSINLTFIPRPLPVQTMFHHPLTHSINLTLIPHPL